MGATTGIAWTDATVMIDRDGCRVRYYRKQDPARPGQQMRRRMARQGLRWCRECAAWLAAADVQQGLCREHRNADYRRRYAADPRAIRGRARARRRGIAPVPLDADAVLDFFGGRCAYCQSSADTWDHVLPVSRGGDTIPGNLVPACASCNASKKARGVWDWLESRGLAPPLFIEYATQFAPVAA